MEGASLAVGACWVAHAPGVGMPAILVRATAAGTHYTWPEPCPWPILPAAVYLVSVAWPSFALRSYLQWRVPALTFLRIFLFALPFTFSTQARSTRAQCR